METKWKEVSLEEMLKSDSPIKCDVWLLSNSRIKYGVDLTQPMLFNEFLHLIGTHLTSMNCKSLFKQANWYIIDEGF
ncbi:hypothetical protein [Solibacillus isronensis]|uniref:hypothetical protein n=1 Tax=Solibacillus isronensis TaxID=412383 RepID=UPI0039A2E8FB